MKYFLIHFIIFIQRKLISFIDVTSRNSWFILIFRILEKWLLNLNLLSWSHQFILKLFLLILDMTYFIFSFCYYLFKNNLPFRKIVIAEFIVIRILFSNVLFPSVYLFDWLMILLQSIMNHFLFKLLSSTFHVFSFSSFPS